jgi:WD40 repeat protein
MMGTIQIEKCQQKKAHKDTVVTVRYSPSGRFLISADQSGEIIFWPRGDLHGVKRVRSPLAPLTGVWFTENEEWLLAGHQGGSLLFYSLPQIKLATEVQLKPDRSDKTNILSGTSRPILDWVVLAVGLSNDSNFYAILEFRDFFTVRAEDFKVTNHTHLSGPLIEYTATSPDGRFAFSGDELGYIYRIQLSKMKIEPFAEHRERVQAFDLSMNATTKVSSTGIAGLALSRDNKFLASTSRAGGVQVWKTENERQEGSPAFELKPFAAREPVRTISDRIGWMRAVCFMPYSTAVMLGGDDGTVEVWDYQSGNVTNITKCTSGIRGIDVSPDGSQLTIGCENGSIFLVPWDTSHKEAVGKARGGWLAKLYNPFGKAKYGK